VSKQLAISAAASTMAMVLFVLLAVPAANDKGAAAMATAPLSSASVLADFTN